MELHRDPIGTLTRAGVLHGDTVQFLVLHERVFFLRHPDSIQHVFKDNPTNYSRTKNLEVVHFKALLGEGILTLDGERWAHSRRAAQPAFRKCPLRAATKRMIAASAVCLERLGAHAGEGAFDAFPALTALAVRVSMDALFGHRVDHQTALRVGRALKRGQEYLYRAVALPLQLPLWVPTARNRRFTQAARVLEGVLSRALRRRRAAGSADDDDAQGDLLVTLMRFRAGGGGRGLSDPEILGQMMSALVAGPENVGNALSWAFYLLARHPDVERRLRRELVDVLGGRDPRVEDLGRLSYAAAVVDEVLRLYPGAWVFNRRALQDDVVCGHRIPRGALVIVSPYITHRCSAFWRDAERFMPERFLQPRHFRPTAYFPFGVGPRRCIGARLARTMIHLILVMLLRRFRVRLVYSKEIKPLPLITLQPSGGVPVILDRVASPQHAALN